jgi:hypothetical protein
MEAAARLAQETGDRQRDREAFRHDAGREGLVVPSTE